MMKRFLIGLAFAASLVGLAQAVNINGTDSTGQNKVVALGFPRYSVTDTITAFATGGQANAVLLTSAYNRVTTVGTAADSVKLPLCQLGPANSGPLNNTIGLVMVVTNAAASNSMNLFPSTGDAVNALSANAAYAMAANKTSVFVCGTPGKWYSILGG